MHLQQAHPYHRERVILLENDKDKHNKDAK